jgi:hypothetical protein
MCYRYIVIRDISNAFNNFLNQGIENFWEWNLNPPLTQLMFFEVTAIEMS